MAHVVSRLWFGITGDSWVVDAAPVAGAGRAGSYLAKYLRKGSLNRVLLERLGFVRRWSSSRGWPGSGRVRLRQTLEGGWASSDWTATGPREVPFVYSKSGRDLIAKGNPLLERVGPDLVMALAAKRYSKGLKAYIEKKVHHVEDVRS